MHRSLTALVALALLASACPNGDEKPSFMAAADGYEPGALFSLWSSGPNDVWLVGGEQDSSVVLRFDGTSWTRNDPPLDEQLLWVHGFAGGPVFVVGDQGAIARWSNGSWEVMQSGFPGTAFWGVWGASPNDVWAVGSPSMTASSTTAKVGDVVLHYDGSSWSRLSVPFLEMKPASASKNLWKVWGTGPNDVFIVGDGGETLHYDGTTFQKRESGVPGIQLFTVWGRAANDVYAIGGLGAPALIHWDGSTWTTVELPPDIPPVLQGLWTAPGQPVFISGSDGYVACLDGDEWTTFDPVTSHGLHAVRGDGAGGVWAVGGTIDSVMPDLRGAVVVSGRDVPAIAQ